MKRIVFFTLFSVLLSLFVSSVEASMQERTLKIENKKELDVRVAYCYVVDTDDVNRIGERAGYHVKGWIRVPSGRSITVTYPKTGYDPLFLLGEMSNGRQIVPKEILALQELPVHPETDFEETDFEVVLALNGAFFNATVENNGINYRVEEKDLNWFKFGKKRPPDEFRWTIDGPMPIDYDGDYDMRGFRRQGTDYALLFATNEYEHWSNLSTPIADAEAIGAELKNRYKFNVDIRKNVTRKQILAAIADYKAKTDAPGDQLLVYFAGHGKFDEVLQDGHIAGTESELPTTDKNLTTYLAFSKLREALDNFPCKRIMLMLDVCYGGTFDKNIALGKQPDELKDRGFTSEDPSEDQYLLSPQDTLAVKTRWYISSGGNEKVKDGFSHSPFAAALLALLTNEDNRDGVLTVPEIRRQMPSQLESELNGLRGLFPNETIEQTPAFGPFGSDKKDDQVFLFIESESK